MFKFMLPAFASIALLCATASVQAQQGHNGHNGHHNHQGHPGHSGHPGHHGPHHGSNHHGHHHNHHHHGSYYSRPSYYPYAPVYTPSNYFGLQLGNFGLNIGSTPYVAPYQSGYYYRGY